MNQSQAKYTIARIDHLEKQKLTEAKAQFTKPAKRLSDFERADLIRKGKVKLRADRFEISHHTSVTSAFDFSKHEWNEAVTEEYAPAAAAIQAAAAKVRDEVMLGDNAEALKLLREFAGE